LTSRNNLKEDDSQVEQDHGEISPIRNVIHASQFVKQSNIH